MSVLLHPQTEVAMQHMLARPPHAILLIGPVGIGKQTITHHLVGQLLGIADDYVVRHPYVKVLTNGDNKSITIESVRDIAHFLALKVTSADSINRVVIIDQAQLLTKQAQNALLKTIEEPPAGTILILTAPDITSLLPTILSRVQVLQVLPPDTLQLQSYFVNKGFSATAVTKAMLMSGGLPGLTQALLDNDKSHPLVQASLKAKEILQKTAFDRVVMTDELAKNKQAWLDILYMLERMAYMALQNPKSSEAILRRWHSILKNCDTAHTQTLQHAQLKLVTLNFMLSL
jgi:hypothetical protein